MDAPLLLIKNTVAMATDRELEVVQQTRLRNSALKIRSDDQVGSSVTADFQLAVASSSMCSHNLLESTAFSDYHAKWKSYFSRHIQC